MSRLLKVELTRLLCRRAVLVILVVAVALPVVIGVARILDTGPPPADQLAAAEEQAAQEAERKTYQRQLARCLDDPLAHIGEPLPEDIEATCEEYYLPQADWYVYYDELNLAQERDEGSGLAIVILLAILMLVAGTTFAGHDWASGSVSNQLLFEPRRNRVWAAKGIVVAGVAGLFTGVVVTAYWTVLDVVARARDLPAGGDLFLDCLQMGWRGALVAAAAALAGYALTMFFRNTVAALGVLLAVSVAGGIVLAVIGIGSIWNPGLNVGAIILDGTTYWADVPCGDDLGMGQTEMCSVEKTLSLQRAVAFLGPLLAAALAFSLVSFQRRDVP